MIHLVATNRASKVDWILVVVARAEEYACHATRHIDSGWSVQSVRLASEATYVAVDEMLWDIRFGVPVS